MIDVEKLDRLAAWFSKPLDIGEVETSPGIVPSMKEALAEASKEILALRATNAELVEALEELVKKIRVQERVGLCDCGAADCIGTKVRAAIAKARGEG